MDGAESYDRGSGGKIQLMPSLDAVAEFNVMTSNYGAQYGLSSGGTVALVFKSGTNTLHASAWEFIRNDASTRTATKPTPPVRRHPNSGLTPSASTLAGPYLRASLQSQQDQDLLFYNMEWRKMIQGGSIDQTVPDTATYGGAGITNVKAQRRDVALVCLCQWSVRCRATNCVSQRSCRRWRRHTGKSDPHGEGYPGW